MVLLIIFVLNTVWEFSHHPLYIDLSGIPKYTHLIIASLADAFILLGIFMVVSLKNKNLTWIAHPDTSDYVFVVCVSLVVATFVELINLNLGRWKYTAVMPTLFGIGVSPLIQLALTGIIALIIITSLER